MGIESDVYTFHNGKRSIARGKKSKINPYSNIGYIKDLGEKYGFNFFFQHSREADKIEGVVFFVERRGISHLVNNKKTYKVVLTRLLDFIDEGWYDWYVNIADKVVFMNDFIAKKYGAISDKNLYLGTPKYDIKLDRGEIQKKYGVTSDKNVLVLVPPPKTEKKCNVKFVEKVLKENGYTIIVKGRDRQPVMEGMKGDYYFCDSDWFPHPTMELIEISDLVFTFDSSVSKESIMASTPFINIHVLEKWLPYKHFLEFDFCENLLPKEEAKIRSAIERLTEGEFEEDFKECREKYLFERGASRRILEAIDV
jgi:hypothetical protein